MNKLLTKLSIWLTFIMILIDKTSGKQGIKCYECHVYPKRLSNDTVEKVCTKFEESKYYQVDCPYSTMCKKRIYRLQLLNGNVQETIERGCAMQKNNSMNYVRNKWVTEVSVEEPYSEGCIKDPKDGSEYCHCRGDLCNSVGKLDACSKIYSGIDIMSIIVVFNLVKYFHHMDYL